MQEIVNAINILLNGPLYVASEQATGSVLSALNIQDFVD
jgi:hypothetical protein